MFTPKESADRRIEAMRQDVIAEMQDPGGMKFRGIPIRQYTRDQLEVMLAHELMKRTEFLNAKHLI